MNMERYDLKSGAELEMFEFISVSLEGKRIIIDNSLDFFNNVSLFPEKIKKANKMLKNIGLPKNLKNVQNNNS